MFIETAGVRTHYQKMGNGPVLIMLHGWGCTWEIWAPLIAPLSEHYTLILPDLPSFGHSGHALEAWSSVDYAQWLAALVEKVVNTNPFALLGHSFGGKIACLYAQTHPSQLRHLIIVDASGIPEPLSPAKTLQQLLLRQLPQKLKQSIPSELKDRFIRLSGSSSDYAVATPYQKAVLRTVLSENITAALENITLPTTIIWGKHDLDTPLHSGTRFHQSIAGSSLHVFEHSGHFPFIDETQHFIKLVTHQLSSHHP